MSQNMRTYLELIRIQFKVKLQTYQTIDSYDTKFNLTSNDDPPDNDDEIILANDGILHIVVGGIEARCFQL